MNWAAIQAVAEAIGAIAVVASLIYLAIQVRQNTRAVRASTYDGLVQTSGDFLRPVIEDAGLARSFERLAGDWADATVGPEERTRAMYLLTQLFRIWENVYYQWHQGLLEDWLWRAWQTVILSYFNQPGIQEWWQLRHMAYSEPFQAFLESASAPEPERRIVTTEQAGGAMGSAARATPSASPRPSASPPTAGS